MNYAPRLTFSYESLAPWVSRVAMASEKVIVYEHADNPDNIHIHMLIMGCTVDVKTLKNWVKETLRLTPVRTQWTFPEQYKGESVNEGFIAYMSKGHLDPKYNKGFTPEFVAEQKAKGFDGKATKAAVRTSKALKYYNSFVEWLYEKSNHTEHLDLTNPHVIRKASWRYMMLTAPMPMPYDISLAKACIMRYCFDYEIPIPSDVAKMLKVF